jgi:hypothetical protein
MFKMKRSEKLAVAALGAVFIGGAFTPEARAWNPPEEDPNFPGATDHAAPLATPSTPYPKAHGYIIQRGADIIYNDGYWFAAQRMRDMQQQMINGVRYADKKDGSQGVVWQQCELLGFFCQNIWTDTSNSWPYAADEHYFNPDTGLGLDGNPLASAAALSQIPTTIISLIDFRLYYVQPTIQPTLLNGHYTSAIDGFAAAYASAVAAFKRQSVQSIGGRTDQDLAAFYLGWASHFMQDMTVVHHTFDEPFKHHSEYESAGDGQVVPLIPGVYQSSDNVGATKLDESLCSGLAAGSRTCFAAFAARSSHNAATLNVIDVDAGARRSFAASRIGLAASLQAGVYAAFLNDVGMKPVHMSAVMAAQPIL